MVEVVGLVEREFVLRPQHKANLLIFCLISLRGIVALVEILKVAMALLSRLLNHNFNRQQRLVVENVRCPNDELLLDFVQDYTVEDLTVIEA